MNIKELRAAIEQYLATLSDDVAHRQEYYMPPRSYAEWQLDQFVDWLQANADDLGVDQGESDDAFISAVVELNECVQARARLWRGLLFALRLLGRANNAQLDAARAARDKEGK